jgi:hypothetical protein
MADRTRDSDSPLLPPAMTRPPGRWIPAAHEPSHTLTKLQGRSLRRYRLHALLGPSNRFGARYFQLFLIDPAGSLSREPVLGGLHATGPFPSYNWAEVAEGRRSVRLEGEQRATIGEKGLREVLCLLGEIVPPGGHLMVEYDSAERSMTARALPRGVPPLATPLGAALLVAGCGPGIRDWHIAEGGREGPRKLQGHKPLTEVDATRRGRQAASELVAFLESPRRAPEDALSRAARRRARFVLSRLPPPGPDAKLRAD